MNISFKKMHGLGNDFVILDNRNGVLSLSDEQITQICDRHFGVGCDQLVMLEPSETSDIKALFYNADGSESGACGNATRCIADIVMTEQGAEECVTETRRGQLHCRRADNNLISVNMGCPQLAWDEIPLSENVGTLLLGIGQDQSEFALPDAVAVGMGNPHCIFFINRLEDIPVEKLGAFYETHPLFPQKANVSFVEKIDVAKFRQITWERGVGRTYSCGSAACASSVAAIRRDLAEHDHPIEMILDGGSLFIEWREDDDSVIMSGPVAYVFDGEINV